MTAICPTCGAECEIDGDYPDIEAWCEECQESWQDADMLADYIADIQDYAYDYLRDKELEGK